MQQLQARLLHGGVGAVLLGVMATQPLRATDVAYVTSYTGSTLTASPAYLSNALGLGGTISEFGSTAIANPPGVPSRTKAVYGYVAIVNWQISPTLNPSDPGSGSVYRIETAHTTATTSPDVTVTAFSNDGTVSESCTNTPAFNQANGGNNWVTIGYITNNPGVTQPVIYFYSTGGAIGPTSGANRLYIDAFKFTEIDVCDGVVGDLIISGPLAASQNFVNVTGVTAGATNVTVYADGSEIGQTNYAAGFDAGALTIPTAGLTHGSEIKATQVKNGCASAMPVSGPPVGSGANPTVYVSLGLVSSASYTGPAGAETAGAGLQYWLKATALAGGSATAPVGGQLLNPGSCWQTITFDWATDPALAWQSGNVFVETNAFCALEHLAFAIDTDNGPFEIYVDSIMNGDVVIESFEGYDAGALVMFNSPNNATFPPPAATYLGAPNSSAISQANVFEGTNACRIEWQFQNTANVRWARVLANRANGATYPQLDTNHPVTVRLLVLPVGEATNKLALLTAPQSQTKLLGESVTFTVQALGNGPFSYQWKKDGANVGTDSPSYTIGSVTVADAGIYTVVVNSLDCTVESSPARLTVTTTPPSPGRLEIQAIAPNVVLTWTNASAILQSSANVVSGYADVQPTATSPYTNAATGTLFYRLRSP